MPAIRQNFFITTGPMFFTNNSVGTVWYVITRYRLNPPRPFQFISWQSKNRGFITSIVADSATSNTSLPPHFYLHKLRWSVYPALCRSIWYVYKILKQQCRQFPAGTLFVLIWLVEVKGLHYTSNYTIIRKITQRSRHSQGISRSIPKLEPDNMNLQSYSYFIISKMQFARPKTDKTKKLIQIPQKCSLQIYKWNYLASNNIKRKSQRHTITGYIHFILLKF